MGNGASGGPPGPPARQQAADPGSVPEDVGSGGDFSCGQNENLQPNAGK